MENGSGFVHRKLRHGDMDRAGQLLWCFKHNDESISMTSHMQKGQMPPNTRACLVSSTGRQPLSAMAHPAAPGLPQRQHTWMSSGSAHAEWKEARAKHLRQAASRCTTARIHGPTLCLFRIFKSLSQQPAPQVQRQVWAQ